MDAADLTTQWKPDGQAFCWQPKATLHRIREALDADNSVASGLLVYVALTEIASDKRTHTFETTHAYLAMRCGLSQRTVQQRVKDLVSIRVLQCKVPSLKAPATYTLLHVQQPSPDDKQPVPRVPQPLHNDVQPLPSDTQRSKKAPLPSSKEYQKNGSKEKAKKFNEPVALTTGGERTLELMEKCREVFGDKEMKQPKCHRRWYARAVSSPDKLEMALADTAAKDREDGLDNPAAFAEKLCKEVYRI